MTAVQLGVWAQPPIRILSSRHEARFRDHILFQLVTEGDGRIDEIMLFYRVGVHPAVNRAVPDFTAGSHVEAEYNWDLTGGQLPPGVEVSYWWSVTDEEERTFENEPQSLTYIDERHDWRTLSSDELDLYWYRGDEDFGQTLFDKGTETLQVLSRDAGVTVTHRVKVFIYGSHADLLDAIAEGAKEWTGGQAFPEEGVVVIGVSPGNLAWGERAVAHELSHLVVHQRVDTPLGGLPRWLDEGLAMYTEGDLEPSYRRTLDEAIQDDGLFTVRSLSSSFPTDAESAHLSYAQSYSLVEFILEEYGREDMAHLLQAFAAGAYFEDALLEVLGLDSEGLDAAWRRWATSQPVTEEEPAYPQVLPRGLPLRRILWIPAGLCCVGGLVLVVTVSALVLLRR